MLRKERCLANLKRAQARLRKALQGPVVRYYGEVNLVLRNLEEAFERRELSGREIAEVMQETNAFLELLARALGWFTRAPNRDERNQDD